MIQIFDYCPSCHGVVVENHSNSTFIGNVPYHKDCWKRVVEEVVATGKLAHFVYEGRICIGVQLLPKKVPIKQLA